MIISEKPVVTFEKAKNANGDLYCKPSVFAESVFLLDGRKFRLTNRNYLLPIYNADIEDGIIISGRQVEKSTTNSTRLASTTLAMPHFKGLYFAPLTSQVQEFSRERIGKLYEYSQEDIIKNGWIGKQSIQNVYFKEFTNGSVNYFKHCFGLGDNIRGITVNGILGDEIQDIHIDAIPVIKETQSHALEAGSMNRFTWYTGTPKTYSNTIEQYWQKSSKAEWIVKCPHCSSYQILGLPNITPKEFVCRKCKMNLPIEARINGFWKEENPDVKFKGFRISQLMVPWISAEDIYGKMTSYSPDKFYNEVLGRSYENSEKPFNPLTLGRMTANNLTLLKSGLEGHFFNVPKFMGIDWGTGEKSYTVVKIYAYNEDSKFQLIYIKRFEPGEISLGDQEYEDYEVNVVSSLMETYQVAYCIADWGFGYEQGKKLKNRFGSRFDMCYYSFSQKAEQSYQPNQNRWVVNRTETIRKYIDAAKKKRTIIWPGADKPNYMWLIDHHLAEQIEYRSSANGKSEEMMYTHPDGQPDDGLHSGVYAYLAQRLYFAGMAGGQGVEFANAYGDTI